MDDLYLDMIEHIHGMWRSYAIQAAVFYDLATRIGDGSATTEELARATDTQEPLLARLMQLLAASGIFVEGPAGTFRNTERSTYLRTDVQGSLAASVRMMGTERYRLTWGKLEECLRTGVPAVKLLYGKGLYEYFEEHPDEEAVFDRALEGVAKRRAQGVLASYDFSGLRTLVDVGGGTGHLLMQIQQQYPEIQGTLLERPSVIERLSAEGVAGKALKLVGGDFFEKVPEGADCYLLQEVLHNWDDESCRQILATCRRAMHPNSVLLICEGLAEQVVTQKNPQSARTKGLAMLMALEQEGSQRTQEEMSTLLQSSGFSVRSVRPASPFEKIIEAIIA